MRITALEARHYAIPLDPPFHAAWDPQPRIRFEETIVIVNTDSGERGYAGGAPIPDLDLLATLLVGTDPEDISFIHETCRAVDFHHGRNWTVEVAVWDVLARARAVPLWQLLGGRRSSYPVYASSGQRLSLPERVERTLEWRDSGIKAIKIRFTSRDWRDDVAVVAAVREAVGESMEIMIDANQAWRMPGDRSQPWSPATARECAVALGDLDVYWLEEPLPTEAVEDYVALRQSSSVRIAGGEMVRSLAESRNLIESGAFDIVQNDVVLAGGIEGAAAVARWAKECGIVWSPHTWTTGLGLLANLHAAIAMSTGEFIEVPYDPPAWTPERRDFMLPEPIRVGADGTVSPPAGPGLGVEPDLDALERWRVR